MRFDEEVFAVILAIIVVGSVFAAAQAFVKPVEPFTAIGLLNENCKIGEYPRQVFVGEEVKLCIFIDNHLGKPGLFQVRFKIGSREHLPSNTTPLNTPTLLHFTRALNNGENYTRIVTIVLNKTGTNIALVFELWRYDTGLNKWVYDNKWVHLYVNATEVLPP